MMPVTMGSGKSWFKGSFKDSDISYIPAHCLYFIEISFRYLTFRCIYCKICKMDLSIMLANSDKRGIAPWCCFAKVLFSVCEGNIGLYCLEAACYSWSPSTCAKSAWLTCKNAPSYSQQIFSQPKPRILLSVRLQASLYFCYTHT